MDTSYVEIGNATVKIATVDSDGVISVQRFHYADNELLPRLQSTEHLSIAVTDRVTAQTLIPLIPADHTREIGVADFADFLGTSYQTIDTLGVDRVLNLYGVSGDAVVVSCGTAITIDCVHNAVPVFGVIMPGFQTSADGLRSRIPVLPFVDLSDSPLTLPAETSLQSVNNGVQLMCALSAREIGRIIAQRSLGSSQHKLVLTGGDAGLMHRLLVEYANDYGPIEIDDALLFRGLIRRLSE